MWIRPRVPAGAVLAAAAWLAAAVSAPAAWSADAKPDAAEAAAAMERAKRQAANPLRVILEASKVKRKVTADHEPVATAAAPAPAAPAAIQPAVQASIQTVAQPAISTAAAASATTNPATVAPRSDEPAAPAPKPVPQVRTLAGASMAVANPADAVPAMAATDRPALLEAMPAAPSIAQPAAVQPKLIEMIEPAIPQRVLDEIGRLVEITADVTIRADGTVAAVQVLPPVPRQLVRYVVAAIERWRFAPLPGEQLHRVQLVFNEK